MLEAINKLEDQKALDDATLEFALKWLDRLDKKSNLYLLMGLRLTASLEDRNQVERAIGILEGIVANKVDFLKDRVQFDLGRMYKTTGNKAKAKEYLGEVAKAESEFQSIAKLYLSEL